LEERGYPQLYLTLVENVLKPLGMPYYVCTTGADLAAVYVARKLGVVVLTTDADLLRYGAVSVDRAGVVDGMFNGVPLCVPRFVVSFFIPL
jgi:hypothetical protein